MAWRSGRGVPDALARPQWLPHTGPGTSAAAATAAPWTHPPRRPLLPRPLSQDLPGALSDAQVAEGLGLTAIKNRDWSIFKTSGGQEGV